MAKGTHEPIIDKQDFDCVQKTLHQRNHKTRQLRGPNYLTGLARCGKCGAPMHVTYPGIEPKTKFKYYVCNNRYNFKSCDQDYIRANILETSVIKKIEKLSSRKDVISSLVKDYVDHNHNTLLPELEQKRKAILKELESLGTEKEKLSKWLLRNDLTPQTANYLNSQVDRFSEKEGKLQERLWEIEDQINAVHVMNYNAKEVCDQLKEFVLTFPGLQEGERKLLIDSLIKKVEVKKKEVTLYLKPPLVSLGFPSTSIAPRGKPTFPAFCQFLLIFYSITSYQLYQSPL